MYSRRTSKLLCTVPLQAFCRHKPFAGTVIKQLNSKSLLEEHQCRFKECKDVTVEESAWLVPTKSYPSSSNLYLLMLLLPLRKTRNRFLRKGSGGTGFHKLTTGTYCPHKVSLFF